MLPLMSYAIFFLVLLAAGSMFWISAWDTELIMSHSRIPDDQMFEDPKEFAPKGPLASILIKKFALNSTIMKSMNERKLANSHEEHILVNLTSNSEAKMIIPDKEGFMENSRLSLVIINRTWDYGEQPHDRFRISYERWKTAIEIYSRELIPMVLDYDSAYWFFSSYQIIEEDWTFHSSLKLNGFVEKWTLSEDQTMLAVVTLYQKLHGSDPRDFKLERTRVITLYRIIDFGLEVIWKKELSKPSVEVTALMISKCFVLYSLRQDIFAFRHIPIRFPNAHPQEYKEYPIQTRLGGYVHDTQLLLRLDVPTGFSRGLDTGFCHKGASDSWCDTVLAAKILQDNKLFMPSTTVYTTQCPLPEDNRDDIDFASIQDSQRESALSAEKQIVETELASSEVSEIDREVIAKNDTEIDEVENIDMQYLEENDAGECIALDLFLGSWEAVKHTDLYQEPTRSDLSLHIKGVHNNGRAALGISKYVTFLNATDDGDSYWTDEGDSSLKNWEKIAMLEDLVALLDDRGKLLIFNEWYNYEVTHLPGDFDGLSVMDLQLVSFEGKTFALLMLEKGVLASIDITSTYDDISGSFEFAEMVLILVLAIMICGFCFWCFQRERTRPSSQSNRASNESSRERQNLSRTSTQSTGDELGVLSGTQTFSRNTLDTIAPPSPHRSPTSRTAPVSSAPSSPSKAEMPIPTWVSKPEIIEEKKASEDTCKEVEFESWTATNTRDLLLDPQGFDQNNVGCHPLDSSAMGSKGTMESEKTVLITFQLEKPPYTTWNMPCKLQDSSLEIFSKIHEKFLKDSKHSNPSEVLSQKMEILFQGSSIHPAQTISEMGIKEGDIIVVREGTLDKSKLIDLPIDT